MILVAHITLALASLLLTAYLCLTPSKTGLHLSYGLVAMTLVTGTYMVATMPVQILSTCISGLLYLAVVFSGIAWARHKLVSE